MISSDFQASNPNERRAEDEARKSNQKESRAKKIEKEADSSALAVSLGLDFKKISFFSLRVSGGRATECNLWETHLNENLINKRSAERECSLNC